MMNSLFQKVGHSLMYDSLEISFWGGESCVAMVEHVFVCVYFFLWVFIKVCVCVCMTYVRVHIWCATADLCF